MRLLAILATTILAATASAQPYAIDEQPDVVPREVSVVRPFLMYADPALPAESTGLRDLSLTEVREAVEGFLDRDERFVVVDSTTRALAVGRSDAQQDLVFIAQQSARLGAEHYRGYNLASAVSELRASAETYERTTRALTHPSEVGDVYLTLALVELELARSEDPALHEARALEAFRTLSRIDPGRVIDGNLYPPSVVELWQQAYAAHFADEGDALRLTRSEAAALAHILDVDAVVYAFTMTDASGTRLFLQFYDHVEQRFDHDEPFAVEPHFAAVSEAVEERLSRAVACQELVLPPPPPNPDPEAGSVYLGLAFSSATYLGRPTDRLFYNRGARVSVNWMIRDTFGLHLSGAQWIASRDPDGELLATVDSTRGTIATVAGGRIGRLRVYGMTGIDIARVGRVRATDAFWCKVSEGVPQVFDDERACAESQITDEEPQGQFGLAFGFGLEVRVAGPFWLHTMARASVTIVPFEDRSVWTPISADMGLAYRF